MEAVGDQVSPNRKQYFINYISLEHSCQFFGDLIEWLLEAGFIVYQFQMSIYYKYAPYGSIIVVLYYVNDCVYWYTHETLGKLFLVNLGRDSM